MNLRWNIRKSLPNPCKNYWNFIFQNNHGLKTINKFKRKLNKLRNSFKSFYRMRRVNRYRLKISRWIECILNSKENNSIVSLVMSRFENKTLKNWISSIKIICQSNSKDTPILIKNYKQNIKTSSRKKTIESAWSSKNTKIPNHSHLQIKIFRPSDHLYSFALNLLKILIEKIKSSFVYLFDKITHT